MSENLFRENVECVIVGAGPAGLQMSLNMKESGVDAVVLERSDRVASFFRTYPRNRNLISFTKRASISDDPETRLRWDWNSLLGGRNFAEYTNRLLPRADDMVSYLTDFAAENGLAVRFSQPVTRVSRDAESGGFTVRTPEGEYGCRYLVMATGVSLPNVPDIPGIELADAYETVSTDSGSFAGQRVLVIGKGNSAMEIADTAIESAALVHMASPASVRLAMRTRHSGGVRTHNSRILDMYQLKMLDSILDCTVERIDKRDDGRFVVTVQYSHADSERDVLVYDRVVRCAGFRFDASVFDEDCTPRLDEEGRLPALSPTWESVNVPDLYFAGTLMQERDLRVSASAFVAGFRHNLNTLQGILRERYHGTPYPQETIPASAVALTDLILVRACRSAALWLQFQHLCDVVVVDQERGTAVLRRDWPVQDVSERFRDEEHVYTLQFRWGSLDVDPIAIERHPDHEHAAASAFLHPVVQRFRRGRLVSEHHVLEDLVGTYHPDFAYESVQSHNGVPSEEYHRIHHVDPLRKFLVGQGLAE